MLLPGVFQGLVVALIGLIGTAGLIWATRRGKKEDDRQSLLVAVLADVKSYREEVRDANARMDELAIALDVTRREVLDCMRLKGALENQLADLTRQLAAAQSRLVALQARVEELESARGKKVAE